LIAHKILVSYKEMRLKYMCELVKPHCTPTFSYSIAWIYFNGLCQGSLSLCKARIVLHISSNHSFHLKQGVDVGTNTREELIALWTLIHFPKYQGIQHLHIVGDSQAVVDWIKGSTQLDSILLYSWKYYMKDIHESFISISIDHI